MKLKTFMARFTKMPTLSVKTRLIGVLALLGAMLIGGAVIGLGAMQMQNNGTREIYDGQMVPANLVATITQRSLMSYIALGEAASLMSQPDQMKQKIDDFTKSQAEIAELKKKLTALPMFIWMGEILFRTRLSEDMFKGLAPWMAKLPGGLLHTNVAGCTIFAAVSGSSAATLLTVGKMSVPELRKRHYPERYVIGTLAGAATLGLMIPPSRTRSG